MPTLDTLAACLRNGILLVSHAADLAADDTGTQLEDLFDADDAAALRHLAGVYYGDTSFTGYQRKAIAAATKQRHSIGDLLRIEHHTRRVRNSRHAWSLRAHLCSVTGESINDEARSKLKELLPAPAPKPSGVRIYRGKNGEPDAVVYRGPSLLAHRLYDILDQEDPHAAAAELLRTSHTAATPSGTDDGMSGSAAVGRRYNLGDSRNSAPEAAPHIVLTLEDVVSLQQGAEDVVLTLTNGARISGAEWATMQLHNVGFVTLLHPVEGPVNLYRTSRFPNLKQRLMAAAEHPECSWPGCRKPASRSQIHHLTAWKNGGETNSVNLTVLCGYHNGVNNDDVPDMSAENEPMQGARARGKLGRGRWVGRGRMERYKGAVRWVPG